MSRVKQGIRTAIIILSACLALSVLALAGLLVYRNYFALQPTTVVVPDNLISPDSEEQVNGASEGDRSAQGNAQTGASAAATEAPATALYLHQKHEGDNAPFNVTNMFPGDEITKNFCVRVSHKGNVTVRYHADIRPGYEKLAEVLKCRIVLLSTGDVLYDGLMRDMPEAITHDLKASEATTSELYYEITAYLETSVGNDYQNKALIADFRWWVEETGELLPPKTGSDNLAVYIAVGTAAVAAALVLVLIKRKREERAQNAN